MKDNTKDSTTRTGRVNPDVNRTSTENRTGRDNTNPYLERLRDLEDYKVASDDPDVRGWNVISGDNEVIGKVDELIVDTKRMKVRYLVVDAKDELGFKRGEESLLVPIGAARLHEKENDVIVSNLTTKNTRSYPVFRGETVSRDHEHSVRRFYEAGGTVPAAGAATTEHETIRDAHTGKTYERQDRDPASKVDSNSRNRVDVVTGNSGDEKAYGKGQLSDTPVEDRMGDHSKAESNTIGGGTHSADDRRRPDGNTTFGSPNTASATDIKDRVGTSGISSSRTSNLPNKDLEQGPTGQKNKNMSEEERIRIHDTDPNVEPPKNSGEAGFNETGDLNRSTSLGNDYKRGSNMGNLENNENNAGINERSRMSSPGSTERTSTPGADRHPERYPQNRPVNKKDLEHSSEELPDDRYDPETDEFYTHDHFDEERFYGNRRNRNK